MIARFGLTMRITLAALFLLASGCPDTRGTATTVAVAAGTVSFNSIAEGLAYFHTECPKMLAQIKADVIAACKGNKLPAEYGACTSQLIPIKEKPINNVLDATRVYETLGTIGLEVTDGQYIAAGLVLIKALDALKIHVALPGGTP